MMNQKNGQKNCPIGQKVNKEKLKKFDLNITLRSSIFEGLSILINFRIYYVMSYIEQIVYFINFNNTNLVTYFCTHVHGFYTDFNIQVIYTQLLFILH